ncbi:MAG: alpha-1,2-fucosyltransferase [Rhodobacterales bacterium]|nr:alpha-1,2-fucosyltransferase [Rhodobacterales bacterium]
MIIARLNGGLGNQMFQYAAGRALAARHGAELGLDLRVYDDRPQFQYGLGHFSISARILTEPELPPSRTTAKLRYMMWRAGLTGPRLLSQRSDGFDDRFLRMGNNSCLRGYWQSERFFEDVKPIIAQEFRILTPPSRANIDMADRIRAVNAVSLHIRRGDYVSNPSANAVHGLCDMGYYARALDLIAERTPTAIEVFVFSDDPDWARDNLHTAVPRVIVDLNDSDHQYEDLRLMSLCSHNIIANSSFSWWGAWLNPSTQKTVIAPRQWFRQPSKHNPDICPPEWNRI